MRTNFGWGTILGVFGLCTAGCGASGANEEDVASDGNSLTRTGIPPVLVCGAATRDANLNSLASQIEGLTTPATYDNPGCDLRYVIDFDGIISGVHVGVGSPL